MSYIYTFKEGMSKEKLKELGYDILPESLCPAPQNQEYYYKMVFQDTNAGCVLWLIDFYNKNADRICADKQMRKVHADIGIKFRRKRNEKHYYLIMNKDLRTMFRAWRLEIDFEEKGVYFTIADGSLPRFYDAENVLETYCPEEIKELVINNMIQKEEVKKEQ